MLMMMMINTRLVNYGVFQFWLSFQLTKNRIETLLLFLFLKEVAELTRFHAFRESKKEKEKNLLLLPH